MKRLPQKLTREEASELCQAISILEQTRPRMIELLKPQIPLCEIPLAHKLGGFFLDGKLLVMDSEKLLYTVYGSAPCRLLKDKAIEIPPLEIFYILHPSLKKFGPFSLEELEEILPELEIENTSLVYEGIGTPRTLWSMQNILLKHKNKSIDEEAVYEKKVN